MNGVESRRERRPQLLQIRRCLRFFGDDVFDAFHVRLAQAQHRQDGEKRNQYRGNSDNPTPTNPHSTASSAKSAP